MEGSRCPAMRARQTPGLERWRDKSRRAVETARASADLFTDYLAAGGPEAIKSLRGTVRKLQSQLEEQKADGRLERYRKLQKDLEECDKVRASLREALLSCQWTEHDVDAYLDRKQFEASTLYGASRELLLRENRLLRSQLEEHLVTTRTSRGAVGAAPNRAAETAAGSKLKQARMFQGPHMDSVKDLREAAKALEDAERDYRLPTVSHAEVQADDGSFVRIQTLERQLAVVAGQKLQLLQQVAALTEQNRVLDMKLEGALDQVADLTRQKREILAHQENLSKDLREHLLSEAKRADTAEASLAEAKMELGAAREAREAARVLMERAMAEAQALQAALQEKEQQVDTLRGLYLELREALEKMAGDVSSGLQDVARRLLESTREQFEGHRALLEDVKEATVSTYRATQHNSDVVSELASQQAALVTEVVASKQTAVETLGAFERQLVATQQLLQQSEADRMRLARQAIAASVLSRMEDKRHDQAVRALAQDVPTSVAEQLAPELAALAEGTLQVAEQVVRTHNTLVDSGVSGGSPAGARGAGGAMLHQPMVPDVVDDSTTKLLQDSKLLRAQLVGLTAGEPAAARPQPNPTDPAFMCHVMPPQRPHGYVGPVVLWPPPPTPQPPPQRLHMALQLLPRAKGPGPPDPNPPDPNPPDPNPPDPNPPDPNPPDPNPPDPNPPDPNPPDPNPPDGTEPPANVTLHVQVLDDHGNSQVTDLGPVAPGTVVYVDVAQDAADGRTGVELRAQGAGDASAAAAATTTAAPSGSRSAGDRRVDGDGQQQNSETLVTIEVAPVAAPAQQPPPADSSNHRPSASDGGTSPHPGPGTGLPSYVGAGPAGAGGVPQVGSSVVASATADRAVRQSGSGGAEVAVLGEDDGGRLSAYIWVPSQAARQALGEIE